MANEQFFNQQVVIIEGTHFGRVGWLEEINGDVYVIRVLMNESVRTLFEFGLQSFQFEDPVIQDLWVNRV